MSSRSRIKYYLKRYTGGFERLAGLEPQAGGSLACKCPRRSRPAIVLPDWFKPKPARITGPRIVQKGGAV